MRGFAPILNQGATNSCVAHAVITSLMIREKVAGVFPIVRPSRLALYWNARAQHGSQRFDQGTIIREAFKVLHKIGVPDETLHPFSEFSLKVNKQPPISSYIKGHMRSGGRYVKIYDHGDDRLAAIRLALGNQLPVTFGTRVTQAFTQIRGTNVVHRPDGTSPVVGGHAMCIVGDRPQDRAFIVQNSWGPEWGDGGYCYMSYDYILWDITRDLWCVDGWKRIQSSP
jgi:C1A family cysteine protease